MNTPDLVGESGYVGKDYPYLFIPDRLWMSKTNKKGNVKWLSYALITPRMRFDISSIGTGTSGSMKNISKPNFLNLSVTVPQIEEQQKIADFLTTVDDKIQQLTRKKSLLEDYKKGIVQQIFSQQIRFKADDGSEFPEWEEKVLGEVGTFQTSSVDKLSRDNEQQVFLVNYMNVYRHESISQSSRSKLQVVTANDNQVKKSDLKKGDILFTPSSETPIDIGHSVVIFEDLENTVYSYHLMRFRPKVELDIRYSHYFCNIIPVLKQLSSYATGSTRFTISVGNFSKVIVPLPSLKEQQKIADFLLALDTKIEQVNTQQQQTKTFKKGLLQKMFV